MLIYMMETARGCPDGFEVVRYRECRHYDVPHSLGCYFVNSKVALEIPEEDRMAICL